MGNCEPSTPIAIPPTHPPRHRSRRCGARAGWSQADPTESRRLLGWPPWAATTRNGQAPLLRPRPNSRPRAGTSSTAEKSRRSRMFPVRTTGPVPPPVAVSWRFLPPRRHSSPGMNPWSLNRSGFAVRRRIHRLAGPPRPLDSSQRPATTRHNSFHQNELSNCRIRHNVNNKEIPSKQHTPFRPMSIGRSCIGSGVAAGVEARGLSRGWPMIDTEAAERFMAARGWGKSTLTPSGRSERSRRGSGTEWRHVARAGSTQRSSLFLDRRHRDHRAAQHEERPPRNHHHTHGTGPLRRRPHSSSPNLPLSRSAPPRMSGFSRCIIPLMRRCEQPILALPMRWRSPFCGPCPSASTCSTSCFPNSRPGIPMSPIASASGQGFGLPSSRTMAARFQSGQEPCAVRDERPTPDSRPRGGATANEWSIPTPDAWPRGYVKSRGRTSPIDGDRRDQDRAQRPVRLPAG